MRLRGKLLLAQLPLFAALAATGFLAAHSVSRLGRSPRAILQDNYRSVLAAQRMKEASARIQDAATRPTSEPGSGDASAGVAMDRGQFDAELRAEEGNVTEAGEGDAARRLREAWERYQGVLERRLDRPPEASEAELDSAFLSLTTAANRIVSINEEAMIRKSSLATEEARKAVRVTSVTALVAFLLGSLISGLMITRMLRPVWLATRTIAQLGEGDFDVRVAVQGNDELAQLNASVNVMAEHLQEFRQSSLGKLILAQKASQAAIDSIPDSVVVFDTRGEVLIANEAAHALLWPRPRPTPELDLAGMDAAARTVLVRARDHVLHVNQTYLPKGFDEAVRLTTASGGERYYLARASAVRGDTGVAGATVVLQDVTSLRLAYELRNDLVATVAHELRTPLTSLRITTHMCLEEAAGPLSEHQADLLHTARDACERMQSVVEQLLDLARIQDGRVDPKLESVSPGALLYEAIAAQAALAGQRQVSLRPAVLPGLPELWVDRERVQLVFSNLLVNAIRHSRLRSSVSIAVLPEDRGHLRFEISDAGEGIAKELQAEVFDRFRQGPAGSSGALGLGLSIARDIVEGHGGEIGLESEPGQGSTFWFTLPTTHHHDPIAEHRSADEALARGPGAGSSTIAPGIGTP